MRRRTGTLRQPPRHVRPRRLPKRHSRAWRWLLCTAALILAMLALCRYIEDRFDPILDALAEYEAEAAVVRAVERAVTETLAEDPGLCVGLYTVQPGDGGAQAVCADTVALNRARQTLGKAAAEAVRALPECAVRVPFGTLTGFSLLNRLGPGWLLRFVPQAYVDSRLDESTQALAINRTRYTAELVLEITINMVLDGKNRTIVHEERVPLASIIMGGEVPLYYSGG